MRRLFGLSPLIARLGKDERGVVLVQFTVYLVVIMGMIGLALDGARFVLLNNSLQALADAAALAGAQKLDGTAGAISNAKTAARAMAGNNPPRWYDTGGSTAIADSGFVFY